MKSGIISRRLVYFEREDLDMPTRRAKPAALMILSGSICQAGRVNLATVANRYPWNSTDL